MSYSAHNTVASSLLGPGGPSRFPSKLEGTRNLRASSSIDIRVRKHPLVGRVFTLATNVPIPAASPHEIASDELSTPAPSTLMYVRARMQFVEQENQACSGLFPSPLHSKRTAFGFKSNRKSSELLYKPEVLSAPSHKTFEGKQPTSTKKNFHLPYRSPTSMPRMVNYPRPLQIPEFCGSPNPASPVVINKLPVTPFAPPNDLAGGVLSTQRRSPPPDEGPQMNVTTSDSHHVLTVHLPGMNTEMITISVRKADTLAIVADQWQAERDCHHEWLVSFPTHDVDLSSVTARFTHDSVLALTIRRKHGYFLRSRAFLG